MTARSRSYAWYVLGLLTTINFVNYVDRFVLLAMYDDFRRVFGMSDGQIGVLTFGFFTVHAVMTVPLGWAADRWDRRKILGAAIIVWSSATLASGWAWGFVSLFVMRAMIGLGEAAYGPISNALLCDTFKPAEKARTVAIFNGGMFAGACVGMLVGYLTGFPLAFRIVAIPGLLLGGLAFFLRVPPTRVVRQNRALSGRTMFADARRALRPKTLRWMVVAGVLISFAVGGYMTWFADFITRYKGLSERQALFTLFVIVLSGGVLGVISGGFVADRLQRRRKQGRLLTVALGFTLSVPFALLAIYVDGGWLFLAAAWLLMFFIPWYNGPMAAVIDDVTDDDEASTAQASFSLMLHLFGTGPGAALVGAASDHIGLRTALLLPTAAVLLAGVFCLVAARHVAGDMAARDRRKAAAEKLRAVG